MLGSNAQEGLTDVAYAQLREAILRGHLTAGTPIFELHLTERLGMSRTPIREALKILARDGFVEALPGRGYMVPRPSLQSIRELFELRETLEGMAARYAALRATKDEIAVLEKLCQRYEGESGNWDKWTATGSEFHAAVIAAARNQRLSALLASLNDQIVMSRRTALQGNVERQRGAIKEHRALLVAITARDPERAESLARNHVRLSFKAAIKAFQDG